jgi:hypothetical protein
MIRRVIPVLAAFLVAVMAVAGAHADEPVVFVAAIDDLPLMPGLVEAADAGMVFDAPAGRIVEAFASGSVERDAVLKFYAETLPQLGWQAAGTTTFLREGETLDLEFAEVTADSLTVRFALSPAGETKQ